MSKTIIAACIGAIATIAAAIIGVIAGKNIEQKNIQKQFNTAMGNGVNIVGNENEITINDIENFMNNYQVLQEQKESLLDQNEKYFNDLTEANSKIEELQLQTDNIPAFNYSSLSLSVDAEDIPINKNNSMVTIDGREYVSKEIAEKLLDENQNMTIKDDTLFIGKVVADRANLVDQDVIEISGDFVNGEKVTDSYGNTHLNAIYCKRYDGRVIYNLKRKYNFLKCSFSIEENGNIDQYTTIIIKVDDIQVYSIEITKLDEPITNVEIPINNCSLLQISCENEDGSCSCIISDAIIYN